MLKVLVKHFFKFIMLKVIKLQVFMKTIFFFVAVPAVPVSGGIPLLLLRPPLCQEGDRQLHFRFWSARLPVYSSQPADRGGAGSFLHHVGLMTADGWLWFILNLA